VRVRADGSIGTLTDSHAHLHPQEIAMYSSCTYYMTQNEAQYSLMIK
jgi:hypothetical protein